MPVTLWRKVFISTMFEGLRRELKAAADVLLFHLGFQAGYQIYDYWRENLLVEDKRLIEAGLKLLKTLNWIEEGEILEFKPQKRKVKISVRGNFETYNVKSERPICYFTSGLYSGFLTKLLRVRVRMREVTCQAKGDKTCTFISEVIE